MRLIRSFPRAQKIDRARLSPGLLPITISLSVSVRALNTSKYDAFEYLIAVPDGCNNQTRQQFRQVTVATIVI
ncbi:MAG: hypothetical protein V7731_18330 [Amphritea sp.]